VPISTAARRTRRATLPRFSGSLFSVTAGPARALAGLLDSMDTAISHSSESSVIAVQLTRQHVVNMLRTAGLSDMADAAQRDLPDPVDSEQAAAWAGQYGVNMGELMDRMGGSP
jgi:hypothetical protein